MLNQVILRYSIFDIRYSLFPRCLVIFITYINFSINSMRTAFLLLGCLLTGKIASAQQFGGYPPSTRWKQINTDTVRVIFPGGLGLEKQAADVANTAQRLGRQTSATIGERIRKISIVLQPRTTISNGYVGLGPWRSEFHLIPPQSSF